MLKLKWLLVVFIGLLYSCSVESDVLGAFNVDDGEMQMYYIETQCADPWYNIEFTQPTFDQNTKISALVSHLEHLGIEVLAVSYEFNQDEALACLACECQTGGVYFVKIKYDETAIKIMTEMGFIAS